ncbi:MAG: spore germination protein [Veillonellaceae bacterium]|nr:spore germination protein [Veillonellaceae bacterium]
MGKTGRSFKKLSDAHPEESFSQLSSNLAALRKLTSKGAELAEDMSTIVADLRKVAAADQQPFVFTSSLEENEKLLKVVLRDCDDFIFRRFKAADRKGMLVYCFGMTDITLLEKNVLETLMSPKNDSQVQANPRQLIEKTLTAASLSLVSKPSEAIEAAISGRGLLFIDGMAEVFVVGTEKFPKRSVSEPLAEEVIRGPHEGFNETLQDNIALIRRWTNDANLKVHMLRLGERSRTAVALVYVGNLIKPGLLEEVKARLRRIKPDIILSSYKIEDLIVDHPWSPFPQVQSTERPDKIVSAIYEGRLAIIVDNSPIGLIVPCTYNAIMQTPEDYTSPAVVASLITLTRHIAGFLAIYLPAIYISIVAFHPGMLPTTLAISIAELRSRTPFPSFLEAVLMEALLEIFQEAVIRLPKKIAGAAGVIGALVIGTTVVEAGLVNPLLVVVVATTAMASFTMPNYGYAMALRFLRVPMLFLASILGLYGVMLGYLAVTVHMCSLRSFGESYLGAILDISLLSDWKDMIIRLPLRKLDSRPEQYGAQDKQRSGDNSA